MNLTQNSGEYLQAQSFLTQNLSVFVKKTRRLTSR